MTRILARTVLELGADSPALRSRLSAVRHTAFAAGNTETAGILDRLIDELFPPPATPMKPPFRIV